MLKTIERYMDANTNCKSFLGAPNGCDKSLMKLQSYCVTEKEILEIHEFMNGVRLENSARMSSGPIELDCEDEDGICVDRHLLRPTALREKVLKPPEEMGVFLRIAEQKEIDSYEHDARGPGKKASGTKEGENRGGNPSAYIISQSLAQIKSTLKKPHAIDYIQTKLIASGLALALTKYKQSAFLYAAKIDKTIFLRMMTIGARLTNGD